MPQHHLEKMNLVIDFMIVSYSTDDSLRLLNNDTLQPILLIEIGIQVLLHSLASLLVLVDALVVVLDFLQVYVLDEVFQLLERVLGDDRVLGSEDGRN